VYNKTVPDDDFIKSKHVVIETQVFLLVVLTDKIKSIINSVILMVCVFFEARTEYVNTSVSSLLISADLMIIFSTT
jgi:hypothetical protein